MDILTLLFSKLGGYLAGAIALLGLWLGYKHQKAKREQAESKAKILERVAEVRDEVEKREAAVDAMDSDDIIDAFGGVRRPDGDRKTPSSK